MANTLTVHAKKDKNGHRDMFELIYLEYCVILVCNLPAPLADNKY